MRELQFWFEPASTYSYLSAARIADLCARHGVRLRWVPFLLGPIFHAHGWNDSPFNLYAAKGRYMWRDMERLCEAYGLTWRRPERFPQHSVLSARLALVATDRGVADAVVPALYRANFAEGRDISDPEQLRELLVALELPAEDMLDAAVTDENKTRLRAHTERARDLGIFGAPSFVVGDELFWGNDRLDAALQYASEREGNQI